MFQKLFVRAAAGILKLPFHLASALIFMSTPALERAFDCSAEAFHRYIFALVTAVPRNQPT